ncbi:MAG: ATP-binding cassette domain-containing protein, partial [Planctomycetota bacterium]
ENGNGKTTLIKLLIGELDPTLGEIKRSPHARIALVNQHHADQIDFSADARLLAAGLQAERDGMVLDVVDRSLEASRERREENQARAAERKADEQRAAEADARRDARRAQAEESDARRETRLEESVQRDARYEQMLAEQQGAARTGSVIDVVA